MGGMCTLIRTRTHLLQRHPSMRQPRILSTTPGHPYTHHSAWAPGDDESVIGERHTKRTNDRTYTYTHTHTWWSCLTLEDTLSHSWFRGGGTNVGALSRPTTRGEPLLGRTTMKQMPQRSVYSEIFPVAPRAQRQIGQPANIPPPCPNDGLWMGCAQRPPRYDTVHAW